MSLILEALRKSEAERRRGATPDVAMELPPATAARTNAQPAWLWPVLAIAALAVVFFAWWVQREPSNAAAPASTQASASPQPADAAPSIVARTPPARIGPPPLEAPASAPQPPPAAVAPPPIAAIPTAPAPTTNAPPPTPASAGAPSDVADIDSTSMPPVKLSMHMWDESPSQRFVILNGQRMIEGDRNGDVSVVAIERNGVVVERNGQRARVPLP